MPAAKPATNHEQLIEMASNQTKDIVSEALADIAAAASSDDTRDKFFPNGIELIHFKLDVLATGVSIDLEIAGGSGKGARGLELTPLDEPEEAPLLDDEDAELLDEEDAELLEPDEPMLEP